MDFLLLGPLEVHRDGRPVQLGRRRGERCLLGLLLLDAGRVVSVDRLQSLLWDDAEPANAAAVLKTHVARLRSVLDRDRDGRHGLRLVRQGAGYVAETDPERVDVHRFRTLVELGRGEPMPDRRAEILRRALACWRGPLLEDIASERLRDRVGTGLEELRFAAMEACFEAELACGRHSQLISELTDLVEVHPLRQRLSGALILALYRDGRQADALGVHRRIQHRLAEELGLDVGAELRQLGDAVLRGDPDLDLPAPSGRATITGHTVVPAQLPADVAGFTGRADELTKLDALLAGAAPAGEASTAMVISAVAGTAGVGKTALAVHWAHRARGQFPDGQLYVNLRGYDVDQPMTAAEALARFLSALGVPGPEIPLEADERAARYRTELAERRMLIVLDNAGSVEQARPLLPGTSSCVVVVTSRDSLAGLVARDGAQRLDLDLLPASDAVALLRRLIGGRVEAEAEAAAELAALCARLPLALRVASELAASRPEMSVADLVAELTDQRRRLARLDAGGDPRAAVAAVFSWSVRHLPPETAHMFTVLGLHPGPDFDTYAAAALADTDVDQARQALELLGRAHLVHPTGAGRYAMHDLLRAYAAGLATADRPDGGRAALGRLFDYYLGTAAAAMDRLHPAEAHRRPSVPPAITPTPDLTDPDTARVWLDADRPNLAAVAAHTAAHGWPTHTVRLSSTLFRYLAGGQHFEALAIHDHARDAARQAGDLTGQAQALLGLGTAHGQMGRFGLAADDLLQALALYQQGGDHVGEARVRGNLGLIEERLGRYEAAADHHQQALALYRQAGDLTGEAYALNNLGDVEERLGRYEPAAGYQRRALALFRQLGNRSGEAWALLSLGTIHTSLGRPDRGAEHHRQALALVRDIGDRDSEAWALNGLGEAAQAAGHPADAIIHHAAARAVADDTGVRDQQARAHAGLGHARHSLGDPIRARQHYEHALAIYTALGSPDAEEMRARIAALDSPGAPTLAHSPVARGL